MKKLSFVLSVLLTQSVLAHELMGPPHLDLEMTSEEYREHLESSSRSLPNKGKLVAEDPTISMAIRLGNRLADWIRIVNSSRTPETAIRLSSSTNRGGGIPIDKPSSYSPALIKSRIEDALKNMPQEMRNILTGSSKLPSTLPVEDQTFITHARLVDRQYQSAARYKSVDQWRHYYIQAANRDVRGYHYLTTQKIGPTELRDTSLIAEDRVEPIKEALARICQNSTNDIDHCRKIAEDSWRENTLAQFYNRFIKAAKKNWDTFFNIPATARRKDIDWRSNVAVVPFNTPSIPKFVPYLRNNIEDEFRFGKWVMRLNFGTFEDGPVLIFKPNVVPHVNGLGGNQIVMDSNQPIEEYESQWTIRHEFGHVLGLPDCYHEFYDTKAQAYVNYQLDVTDLMCSRAGNMNERIYLELRNAYGK